MAYGMRHSSRAIRVIGIALTVLAVAFAGLYLYTALQVRQAEARYPPIGQFVAVEGLRLHYVSQGSGRPVVFLHGNGLQLRDFTTSIFDRAAQEYHAIAFDRPGHGYSDPLTGEAATPIVQARLIHGALQSLGVEKPVLVGHSWSGTLVLAYALEYPDEVSAIVTLGGVAYRVKPNPAAQVVQVPVLGDVLASTLLVPIGQVTGKATLEALFSPDPVPPGYLDIFLAFLLRPIQIKAALSEATTSNSTVETLSPRYGEIGVPVVIVTGDSDTSVVPQQHAYPLHEAIPDSKLIVLPDTGHMPHHSQPEAVMDAIRQAWELADG
jgi:pimeloyl-ACP methyl ester carboxylesterase